jgi:hypothetical protein
VLKRLSMFVLRAKANCPMPVTPDFQLRGLDRPAVGDGRRSNQPNPGARATWDAANLFTCIRPTE